MRRELAIAVLATATVACPCVEAQVRSGSRMVSRPAISGMRAQPVRTLPAAPRPGMIAPSRGFVTPNRFGHSGVIINPRFRHHHHHFIFSSGCFGPFFNPFLCRQSFFASPLIGPSPIFWPDVSQAYPAAQQTVAAQYQPDPELRADIDRLTQEVEMLRQEQQARNRAQQALSTAPEQPTPTMLVFRDGHLTKVQNYAIAGQALWIFAEQHARKVRFAELDLKATQQINAERGVEFFTPAH